MLWIPTFIEQYGGQGNWHVYVPCDLYLPGTVAYVGTYWIM